MSAEPKILYKSRTLRVIYQPADSDLLVLSFNGGDFAKSELEFYGSSHFAKRGYAAVGFVDLESKWFPVGEMNKAIYAVNTQLGRRPNAKVITYGISMGAYGALKYGRRLRAHAALAFAPQWSIDPALVGHFDRRYLSFIRPKLHTGMQVRPEDLAEKSFIFFDPRAPEDAEHARLLGEMPNVHRVLGPFLGHPTIQFWTEMHVIDALFMLAVQPGTDGRDFRWLIRSKRAGSSRYFLGLASHLHWQTDGRYLLRALESYREAVRLNRLPPHHKDYVNPQIALANALLDARQPEEARKHIDAVCAHLGGRGYSSELRELLLRVDAGEKARELTLAALELQPHNAELRIDLARMFLSDLDIVSAKRELDIAARYAGRRPLLWQRISALYSRMGAPDQAIVAEQTFAAMPGNSDPSKPSVVGTLRKPPRSADGASGPSAGSKKPAAASGTDTLIRPWPGGGSAPISSE